MSPTFLHAYGLCCKMSDPKRTDGATSGSNIVNPAGANRKGPTTRQQWVADTMAAAARLGTQSVCQDRIK